MNPVWFEMSKHYFFIKLFVFEKCLYVSKEGKASVFNWKSQKWGWEKVPRSAASDSRRWPVSFLIRVFLLTSLYLLCITFPLWQQWYGVKGAYRCFSPLWGLLLHLPWWQWPSAQTTGCTHVPSSATALPTPLRTTPTTRTKKTLELSPTQDSGGSAALKVQYKCLIYIYM